MSACICERSPSNICSLRGRTRALFPWFLLDRMHTAPPVRPCWSRTCTGPYFVAHKPQYCPVHPHDSHPEPWALGNRAGLPLIRRTAADQRAPTERTALARAAPLPHLRRPRAGTVRVWRHDRPANRSPNPKHERLRSARIGGCRKTLQERRWLVPRRDDGGVGDLDVLHIDLQLEAREHHGRGTRAIGCRSRITDSPYACVRRVTAVLERVFPMAKCQL